MRTFQITPATPSLIRLDVECVICQYQFISYEPGAWVCPQCNNHLYVRMIRYRPDSIPAVPCNAVAGNCKPLFGPPLDLGLEECLISESDDGNQDSSR